MYLIHIKCLQIAGLLGFAQNILRSQTLAVAIFVILSSLITLLWKILLLRSGSYVEYIEKKT